MLNQLTRREALGTLGLAALVTRTAIAAPSFPKGAIIRTLLKDYNPEDLAGGPTLFHEHMSFVPDFMPRWNRYARETAIARNPALANNPAPAPAAAAPSAPPSGEKYFMED